ncbi:MAG: type II toxin-antitoxin system VapC family toxin [Thermoleophilaceae bacterium]
MRSAVLDAWAILALLRDEPAAGRVRKAIGSGNCCISAINLGEGYYSLVRSDGGARARASIEMLQRVVRTHDPDWPLVRTAAEIKARGGLSYADSFCIATARRLDAPLLTGDPEILAFVDEAEMVDLRA